jgi:WD40 repeat protein
VGTLKALLVIGSLVSIMGCQRLSNSHQSLHLKCGRDLGPISEGARYFQIKLGTESLRKDAVAALTLNQKSILDRLSTRACFKLHPSDVGSLVVTHQDRRHAEIIEVPPIASSLELQSINLKPFTPVGENADLQSSLFKRFCPSSSNTIFVGDRRYAFNLNLSSEKPAAGLKMKLVHSIDRRPLLATPLLEVASILGGGLVSFALDADDKHQDEDAFKVQLEVSDHLGSKFITPVCTIVIDPRIPVVNAIGGSSYFPGMYVEVEKNPNLEFKLTSSSPLLRARLIYFEAGTDTIIRKDEYVPFRLKDDQWSLITLLPDISGQKDVTIELENASGFVQRYFFTTDFGLRFYLESSMKRVSQSRNQRYLTYYSQGGELRVIDAVKSQVVFEQIFSYEILDAKVDDNGQYLVVQTAEQIRVVDLLSKVETSYKESVDSFEILSSTHQVLFITESSKLKWIDVKSGQMDKLQDIPGEIIRAFIVSDDERRVFVATDKKSIHSIANEPSGAFELIEQCPFGTINVLDFSPGTNSLVYNCNEVIFFKQLELLKPAEEILRFPVGDGARSIAFASSDKKVLVGSDLGEWYLVDLIARSKYPQDRLEGLDKGLFFRSSVVSMIVSSDGQSAIVGSDDGEAKVFSVSNQQLNKTLSLNEQIIGMGYAPDQKSFYIASPALGLHFYSVWNETASLDLGQRIRNIALSNQGILTASTITQNSTSPDSNAAAVVVDIGSFKTVKRIEHSRTVNHTDISKDGRWLLSASDDGSARLSGLETGAEFNLIEKWNPGGRAIRKAVYSNDNRKIAIFFHASVLVFDRDSLDTPIYRFDADDWVPHAEFAVNDRYLVVASADKKARIIDLATSSLVAEVVTQHWVWYASLSVDGRYFAVLSWDNKLRVFESQKSADGDIVGLSDYLTVDLSTTGEHMTFSPDGRYLAASLWSGETLVLSVADKRVLKVLCSQKGFASAPTFSPDNMLLAVGHNNMAYVYRVADGKPMQVVTHGDRVSSLAFYGNSLISAGGDKILKKTQIDLDSKASCQ